MRHLNNGTDHRHSKSCCDQSSPARRTMTLSLTSSNCLKVRSHMRGWTRAGAGGKLASTQIITCVHTCAVMERRRSGSKNRSARNGSNTQFTAPASKPCAPNHHRPQEMADPPASAPRMCEHTRGSGAGISKSARLRSATAPRMCERSFIIRVVSELSLVPLNMGSTGSMSPRTAGSRCDTIFSPPYILTPGWKYRHDIFTPLTIFSPPLPVKAIYDRHIIYNCWGAFSPYV